MKKSLLFICQIIIVFSIVFVSCEETANDACSSELGDIGDDYGCDVPVMPQICTIDGVDDHWVLDGDEYDCPGGDCTDIPQDLVEAILAKPGCSTKKSLDLDKVNRAISIQAEEILTKLKSESVLCNN